MMKISSKMMTQRFVMTSLLIKILKIDKFCDFCAISIITVGQTYLDMLFPL